MILTFNNKILSAGSKWLEQGSSPTPGPGFRTVIVGNQEWMAENLAIDDGGEGIVHFDNVTANGVNFGTQYYYSRAAAERIATALGDGWHLPNINEWGTLATDLGGVSNAGPYLKSTTGWDSDGNGVDSLGWTGLPCGYYDYYDGLSVYGSQGIWLTSTNAMSYDRPYTYGLPYNSNWLDRLLQQNAKNRHSVRLVRDIV